MAKKKAPAEVDPFAKGEKAVGDDSQQPSDSKKTDADDSEDFWKKIKNRTKKRIYASSSKERSIKPMNKMKQPNAKGSTKR